MADEYAQRELADILAELEAAFTEGKLKGIALVAVEEDGGFRERVVFGQSGKLPLLSAVTILAFNVTRMIATHPESHGDDNVTEYHS